MRRPIIFILVALGLAVVPGCNRSAGERAGIGDAPVSAAAYKEGHGLRLSPAAHRFVGLETAEVALGDRGAAKAVMSVPAEALLRTAKGDFVFVANGDWFLRTPVQTGGGEGGWIGIREGLYEGDAVVTKGVRALWLAELQAVNGGIGCADGH